MDKTAGYVLTLTPDEAESLLGFLYVADPFDPVDTDSEYMHDHLDTVTDKLRTALGR